MSKNEIKPAVKGQIDASPVKGLKVVSKEKFAGLIEAYAKKNPVKFAVKKDKLEAELAKLK